jgi:NADPH:quinone reductase-like Zn-dependent oxidoreductase
VPRVGNRNPQGIFGRRYDAIIDIGGNSRLSHLRRDLTPDGTLVIVGGETDGRWLGGFDRQLRAMMLSPLVSQRLGTLGTKESSADLFVFRDLVESGKVTPVMTGPTRSARRRQSSGTSTKGRSAARLPSPSEAQTRLRSLDLGDCQRGSRRSAELGCRDYWSEWE